MDKNISNLIEISRFYGKNKEYVIAGGGNTSFKTRDKLWVKASGFRLSDITEKGFVSLDRNILKKISKKIYCNDLQKREDEIKNDLAASKTDTSSPLRPSVEAMLHHIITNNFVVHTHSTVVNALMCSRFAEKYSNKLFGNKVLYIPYTNPGYLLYKKIEKKLKIFEEKHNVQPNIILIQNHGVFVSANTISEIKNIYEYLISRIREKISGKTDHIKYDISSEHLNLVLQSVNMIKGYRESAFKIMHNSLVEHFMKSKETFKQIADPFTPDIIVYCKSKYLYIDDEQTGADTISSRIQAFKEKVGYLPKIILIREIGCIGIESSTEKAGYIQDTFFDQMKISYYSDNFGGPHFLKEDDIKFIENWEAEHYRQNIFQDSNSNTYGDAMP